MSGHIATSARVDWETPDWILDCARAVFGQDIVLDPCASATSAIARVNWRGPPHDADGLAASWAPADNAFVNPPFGTTYRHVATKQAITAKEYQDLLAHEKREYLAIPITAWAKKWHEAHFVGGVHVITLTPANVDTALWHDFIFPSAAAVCFLKGRVTFKGAPQVAPMPIAISYYGPRKRIFTRTFAKHGEVVIPAGMGGGEETA